ncbi:hypothetical protein YTPLAS18_07460 [Nitrospira sp.]|nr:hypothetical protein YTPLAS18_07460 [Nitrospira sp.]
MRLSMTFVMCAMMAFMAEITEPSGALAKPKKIVSNGCTVEQLQSNFGESCGRQMEQDLINNRSYTHVMFCNGGQMTCCTVSNSNNQVLNCRRPAGSALQLPLSGTSMTGSVMARGVEGAEDPGEEVSAPDWITEKVVKDALANAEAK